MKDQAHIAEKLPESLLKIIINYLNKKRIREEDLKDLEKNQEKFLKIIDELKKSPIALTPELANQQHYELPYEFFELVLGKYKKYSCCYYDSPNLSLDEAEKKMLDLYIERGEMKNGHSILDLGCGWGSFSLYIAEKFPKSKVVAVTNSKLQKEYIDNQIKIRKLKNLKVIKADMNVFETKQKFDRVISVEMFEHMRNYEKLLEKISRFMNKNAKLFVHIFAHRQFPYFYVVRDETDWMAKYFFTNGIMPSANLLHYFQKDLYIEKEWYVNGRHYYYTSLAWLQNYTKNKDKILEIFRRVYDDPELWLIRWKIFFLAVAEFFKTNKGTEWFVVHYLFAKK
ncbi:MAG: class I SAM-dependent methyltransferase [Leptospiraceae bacterium]|nr:class I SAM-dependent methyltransferase [Leptospiraceae bacterium]MDW7975703.1 class I SAM-dependent methyltransferase [Leptospiraceae bacterium]